jgi:hypothetical protein
VRKEYKLLCSCGVDERAADKEENICCDVVGWLRLVDNR